ncbi:MAG TPA: hypothetical protein VHX59_15470 [Mycobacteriales bacterium]|jgi:hypothetical protein|nr:hypothetical protein [Mycobacteriales bacterium]
MMNTRLGLTAAALLLCLPACTSAISGKPHVAAGSGGCAGGAIVEPKGGPYCYATPDGFTAARAMLSGAQYTSAVALDKDNLIIAGVYPAPSNLDTLSDQDLTKALDELMDKQDSPSFKLASTSGTLSKPPGGRAVEYRATTDSKPPITVDLYVISKGHTKVQLNCQSTDQPAKIETACGKVLQSMRITATGN